MNLNISMLKDYLKCPQLAYNTHVLRRGLANKPTPLDVGTLFHEAAVMRWHGELIEPVHKVQGGPPEEHLFASNTLTGVPPSWDLVSDDAREEWAKHRLWLPLNAWSPDPAWEVIEVEAAMSAPVNPPPMVGPTLDIRPDAIVKWNGKFWDPQWKTYADDLLGLQERVRLSYHEVMYQYIAEQNGYTPWGGTILLACQKLPGYRVVAGKRQEVTDEQRIAALTQHYLIRSPETQASMVWYASRKLDNLQSELFGPLDIGGTIPGRNYDSCFGPFGRGRCPFYGVCHEREDINGPRFTDLKDRYATVDV